jgi:hypothetical protein
VVTYVTHIGSAKQCIADGVQQHVGIAMTKQSFTMFNLYTAHPQVAALY